MAKYITCPDCGAHLDPGEPCDCRAGEQSERASHETPQKRGSWMDIVCLVLVLALFILAPCAVDALVPPAQAAVDKPMSISVKE